MKNMTKLVQLEDTIRVLCPIIKENIRLDTPLNEYSLRRELVACILGSQVRYEMAYKALERIENAGLLADEWWSDVNHNFEIRVFEQLSGNKQQNHEKWCYRFPKSRANQLEKTRNAIAKRSLFKRLYNNANPKDIRRELIMDIPGIGPKQASMFLRNIGMSYDLAILDAHVLRFMNMQNVLYIQNMNIGTLKAYERTECIAQNYASVLGYPVGYLDWAIWATMRAARELGL